MKRLFPKLKGNTIIYVIIILGLISMLIVGFFKIELTLNETARVDLSRKQAEVLSHSAFDKANSLINDNTLIDEKTVIFDETIDKDNYIKATLFPLKEKFFLLEAVGQSKHSRHLIESIYIKAQKMLLDSKVFVNHTYIDKNKQKFFDYNFNPDKASIYFFERSRLDLGKKAKLELKNDVLLLGTKKQLFEVSIYSPMLVDGNMEVFGNLVLKDSLEIKGQLIIHGDLKLNAINNLTVGDKVTILGDVVDFQGKRIEKTDRWKIEKLPDELEQQECFYFLGFRS